MSEGNKISNRGASSDTDSTPSERETLIARLTAVIDCATRDSSNVDSQMACTPDDYAAGERDREEAEAVRDLVIAALRRRRVTPKAHSKLIAAAAAVHNPTNGEREAWRDEAIRRYPHAEVAKYMRQALQNAFLEGARFAAGFRRSEVPEPSAEVVELKRQIARIDADLGKEVDRVEQLHDIADRLSWAIAPISEIGEHSSANDPWENAIEYAESRVWAEPQGEPSDAQVRAAAESIARDDGQRIDVVPEWADAYMSIARAALRAAGGVR